jgi:hypothetical protein
VADRRILLSILLFLYIVRYEERKRYSRYLIEEISLDGGTSYQVYNWTVLIRLDKSFFSGFQKTRTLFYRKKFTTPSKTTTLFERNEFALA